ncbi:hypothetical protein CBL_20507 [Carabus blaptoides fortunei]
MFEFLEVHVFRGRANAMFWRCLERTQHGCIGYLLMKQGIGTLKRMVSLYLTWPRRCTTGFWPKPRRYIGRCVTSTNRSLEEEGRRSLRPSLLQEYAHRTSRRIFTNLTDNALFVRALTFRLTFAVVFAGFELQSTLPSLGGGV